MGLFDRFKKKDNQQPATGKGHYHLSIKQNTTKQEQDEAYETLSKYREYIVLFLQMQLHGNFAPIGAYEDVNGIIHGFLYMAEDQTYNISIQESIDRMEKEFEQRMAAGAVSSYIICFHSQYTDHNDDHSIAEKQGEFRAFSIRYRSNTSIGTAALPYEYADNGGQLRFGGLVPLSREQSDSILQTRLQERKDYFDEKVSLQPEIAENGSGIKIARSNHGAIGSLWAGILGYERMESADDLLIEYCAYASSREPVIETTDVVVSELSYGDVVFRAVRTASDSTQTVFPVVRTNNSIPFTTTQVNDWTHIESLEAVINGGGRDTFGLSFFATDYAVNKHRYHHSKHLDIQFSGIVQVLDISGIDDRQLEDGTKFSDDFCAYMPNKDLAGLAGFDFIGILKEHRSIRLLEDNSAEGYIIKVKLLNIEEEPDAFTIDMFVNKQNMRFDGLENGMKITGCFQLQGQIAGEI